MYMSKYLLYLPYGQNIISWAGGENQRELGRYRLWWAPEAALFHAEPSRNTQPNIFLCENREVLRLFPGYGLEK